MHTFFLKIFFDFLFLHTKMQFLFKIILLFHFLVKKKVYRMEIGKQAPSLQLRYFFSFFNFICVFNGPKGCGNIWA